MEQTDLFGSEKISKILWKLAPPVMLAQLIQALYNIIDSLFVGKYSDSGLTALSIIYPIQLLMIAFAVGTVCVGFPGSFHSVNFCGPAENGIDHYTAESRIIAGFE